MVAEYARLRPDTETGISYLPLSHAAAQLFDIYVPIVNGATVYFAQPDALKVCIMGALYSRPGNMMPKFIWVGYNAFIPKLAHVFGLS